MYYLPTSDWAEVPYVVFQDQRVAELVTTSVFLLPIMQLFVVLNSQEMTYTVSTCVVKMKFYI